jgi:Family of unknown function (DUF6445)
MVDLNGKLRLHSSFTHRLEHIGNERAPVLVIDNFISDPQVLIDYAAAYSEFESVSDAFYPGVRAPIPPIYSFAVRAFLGDVISNAFGLGDSRVAKELSSFSLVTTAPASLQVIQRLPHFDNTDDKQLALLHYLCPAKHGGTSFYRHRATGFETVRPQRLAEYLRTLNAELASLGPPPLRYMNGDNAMFERIASFEAAFNRMLVYRSITLHSADIAPDFDCDADPRAGRLTANTFFFFR